MFRSRSRSILIVLVLAAAATSLSAQRTGKKPVARPAKTPVAAPTVSPTPLPTLVPDPPKRNERPGETAISSRTQASRATHFYKFSRPGFTYSDISIEHDDAGIGRITFMRQDEDEAITDPIKLSPATLATLDDAFAGLDFLDSTDDYQYASRDFSNLGNIEITLERSGRKRTAKFNWTENKQAKVLMDVYRSIANEATWKFEMGVAQENQPLETPRIMDIFDSYYRRGDISDPPHLIGYLTELSNDERLPLIARNHARRIVADIEKVAAKKKK